MAKASAVTKRPLQLGDFGPEVEGLAHMLAGAGGVLVQGLAFDAQVERAVRYFQATHLGPQGLPLGVDGRVGPDTAWALRFPMGELQRAGLPCYIPRGLSAERTRLLTIAHGYHDVSEDPPGSNRGELIDQWTGFHGPAGSKGPSWCAFYASAMWLELLGRYPFATRMGSCWSTQHVALQRDQYVSRGAVQADGSVAGPAPAPGDQGVMLYPVGPDGEQHGHTVLFSGVELNAVGNASRVLTIEGNCANRVARRVRPLSSFHGWVRLLGEPGDYERGVPKGVKIAGKESTT